MSKVMAHRMVADLARKLAEAVYEESVSRDNELYRGMKASHPGRSERFLRMIFVRNLAPELVGDARAVLAKMLAESHDEALKLEIYEALTQDNAIPQDRDLRPRLVH